MLPATACLPPDFRKACALAPFLVWRCAGTVAGDGSFDPAGPVVDGSMGSYRFTYFTGRYGVDSGGTLMIAVRLARDRGRPQLHDSHGEDYAHRVHDRLGAAATLLRSSRLRATIQ
jgi:hypothetical protein